MPTSLPSFSQFADAASSQLAFKSALARLLIHLAEQDNTVSALSIGQTSGVIGFDTLASLNANLAFPANTVAYVTSDSILANNAVYRKIGASGAGSWVVSSVVHVLQTLFDSMFEKDFGQLSGYAWAVVDAAGKIALGIAQDGSVIGKFTNAELIAARGTRVALNDRISQALSPYGLPLRHMYGEWFLRETRMRLRKLERGEAATFSMALIGDSWTHNQTYWSGRMATKLTAQYGDAGSGYCGFGSYAVGGSPQNSSADYFYTQTTFSGTWSFAAYNTNPSPDLGAVTSSTIGSRQNVYFPAGYSAMNLFYIAGVAGVIRYSWDNGATWTTLDVGAGTAGLAIAALTGVIAGAGHVTFEVVSGTITLCGVELRKAGSGVRVSKIASSGSNSGHWVGVNAAQWQSGLAQLAPNLVTILLGTNDQASLTPTQFKANLQTLITRVKTAAPTADIALIIPCENGLGRVTSMSQLSQAMVEAAVANKCAFLDLQYMFGDTYAEYGFGSARNWFNADNAHPDAATGGAVITDAVYRLITG